MFQLNNYSSDNSRSVVRTARHSSQHQHPRTILSHAYTIYVLSPACNRVFTWCVSSAPTSHPPQVLALRALNRLFLLVSTKRVVAAVANSSSNTFLCRCHLQVHNPTPLLSCSQQHRVRTLGALCRRNHRCRASDCHLHPKAAVAHSASGAAGMNPHVHNCGSDNGSC
jgi:hypothetical protein